MRSATFISAVITTKPIPRPRQLTSTTTSSMCAHIPASRANLRSNTTVPLANKTPCSSTTNTNSGPPLISVSLARNVSFVTSPTVVSCPSKSKNPLSQSPGCNCRTKIICPSSFLFAGTSTDRGGLLVLRVAVSRNSKPAMNPAAKRIEPPPWKYIVDIWMTPNRGGHPRCAAPMSLRCTTTIPKTADNAGLHRRQLSTKNHLAR
mmetsp:Transcript_2888/g.10116  ORF Transcript_2888/g.10116 Transcript_2888/m.10116 type:complete len:205 (-) Transcript_2888:228-842(-)